MQQKNDSSFKLPDGKWVRSTDRWIAAQGSDEIEPFLTISEGKCLRGLRNRRTRATLLTQLTRATIADFLEKVEMDKKRRERIIY